MRIGRAAGLTDTGRRRLQNEDAFVCEPPLFAVADGMGGAQAGELASSLAAAAIEERAAGLRGEEAVAALVREANATDLRARADQRRPRPGMGTTTTLALVDEQAGTLTLGHVGDSRAYLFRDGALEQITDRPLARRRADPQRAAHRGGGRSPSSPVGDHPRARHRRRPCRSTRRRSRSPPATSSCSAPTGSRRCSPTTRIAELALEDSLTRRHSASGSSKRRTARAARTTSPWSCSSSPRVSHRSGPRHGRGLPWRPMTEAARPAVEPAAPRVKERRKGIRRHGAAETGAAGRRSSSSSLCSSSARSRSGGASRGERPLAGACDPHRRWRCRVDGVRKRLDLDRGRRRLRLGALGARARRAVPRRPRRRADHRPRRRPDAPPTGSADLRDRADLRLPRRARGRPQADRLGRARRPRLLRGARAPALGLPRAREVQVPLRAHRGRPADGCPRCPVSGQRINGVKLWVEVGPLQFQPGEIAKIFLVIFLAGYLRDKRESLALGPDEGSRAAARDLGRGDARPRPDQRPRLCAAELRDLPGDALHRDRPGALRRDRPGALRRRRRRALQRLDRVHQRVTVWLEPWTDEQGATARSTASSTIARTATRTSSSRASTRSQTAGTAAPGSGEGRSRRSTGPR